MITVNVIQVTAWIKLKNKEARHKPVSMILISAQRYRKSYISYSHLTRLQTFHWQIYSRNS